MIGSGSRSMSTGREVGVVVVVVGVGVVVVVVADDVVEFPKRRRNKNDVPVCQEQRSLLTNLLSHSAHLPFKLYKLARL